MTSQTGRAKARLATLSSSLDDLEAVLEPLFAQTFSETVVSLEPIQQAKLQTVLPYLVYDLVFIYLKSRGIDPKTHPVVPELDRVKQYFEKISFAENPPTRRAEIDKGAAQRFIKHAIAQATTKGMPDNNTPPTSSLPRVQAKITSKMLERQLYEQKLKEQDAQQSEEEGLAVFDGTDDEDRNTNTSDVMDKGKGKAQDISTEPDSHSNTKRKRPAVDPFAGYGEASKATGPSQLGSSNELSNKNRKPDNGITMPSARTDVTAPDEASSNQNSPAPGLRDEKKSKKKKRKVKLAST